MSRPSMARLLLLHLFYDGCYVFVLLAGLPYVLFRMATRSRFRAGLAERLGRIPDRDGPAPCLWVHGVSVGELLAATEFVSLFRRRHPGWTVVISTTTRAGYAVARKRFPEHQVIYYPLDLSFVVRRVLRRVRPTLVILIELEIWPNFLLAAARRGVPVALINGRISHRSYRGYRLLRRFLSAPIRRISLYCVQNERYAGRLRALRVAPERILVTGTMKFDTIVTEGCEVLRGEMIEELGFGRGRTVFIGGSTHFPEERILLRVYRRLLGRFPDLMLVLAPRRPERFDEVEEEIRGCGFRAVRRSRIRGGGLRPRGEVVLVDTIGELRKIYAAADLVFVGGSLVPHGGQNMMEPAGLGRAVLFGPSVDNFQDSVDLLLKDDAAVLVRDEDRLEETLRSLLEDPVHLSEMGARARRIIRANQGASVRNLEILEDLFQELIAAGGTADNAGRNSLCRVR